jgi:hypothetical protein
VAARTRSGEVVHVRKLKAKDMAEDIHSGMGDTLLMEKYNLNQKQLESVLRKLLDADWGGPLCQDKK